ncbi:polycystin-1-like protein 1 [Alosa pseudoharengus]|uniref:polycystin-1-like protein 1 n=1 Tax=Alosa pseudoharengus TaxID=34774 RepID=UPI003F8AC991
MAVFASGEGSKMVVRVYTEKQAYVAGTEITFLAMTEEPDPLEFQWDFGNRQPVRTTLRAITKKFHLPKRYNISVRVFSGQTSAVSDVYAVIVQRAIKPNKLQFQTSVLVNTTVEFKCRVSAGSDVTYLWRFGDGTTRHGWRTERHIFDRLGEFVVGVTMHNLVSSASLNDHIFVTSEHCLPPPVKNMGPHKIQVQRDQSVRLAVTYEAAEIQCDMYQGLQYTWVAYDSSGSQIQLASVETHKQNIELPAFFLHYGIYRAVAKVQIKGSVVYSNYSVCVEVGPRPPISIIQGATNLFISRHDNTLITLNGEQSHDPDFPQIPLSYSWHCRPLSRTEGRCFQESLQLVPRSLPQLVFPASALNPTFDQFKFTLTVQSGGRSSSSEMFVTITPNAMRNLQINCGHCQGTGVHWNEQFSAEAFFEKDTFVSEDVVFSWKLYIVNGTSRVISEGLLIKAHLQKSLKVQITPKKQWSSSPTPSFESIHKTTFDDFSEFLLESINTPEHQVPVALETDSTGPHVPTARMEPRGTHGHSPAPSDPRGSYEEGEALVSWGRWRTEGKHEEAQTLPADQPDEVTQRLGDVWNARQSPGDYDDASDLVLMGETDSHLSGIPVIFEEGGSGAPAENDSDRPLTREHHSATGDLNVGISDYDFPFIGIEEGDSGTYAGRPTGVGFAWENGGRDLSEPDHPEESFLMDSKRPGLAAAERTLLDLGRELVDPVVLESHAVAGISSSVITLKPYSLSPNRHYMLAVTASERWTAVGKSQLFFRTLPAAAPEGMACLVQPSEGLELLTHFSVFCASGREDLLYKYSYTVGKSPAVVLYEGRDFQHYFHLPSGGHENHYTVTVYTVIENKYGATTKACAATVRVLPRFQRSAPLSHAPEQDLLAYTTQNLSRLTQMGSVRDVQNAVSLLAGVLGRLRQEPVSSQELLGATHNALVTALCCLTPRDEVTLHSAKLLIKHIQDLSALFPKERGSEDVPSLEKRVVNAFVSALSHTLTALRRFSKEGIELTSDVLRTITDVSLNPYYWGKTPVELTGDIADLRLYNCTTWRKIRVRHLDLPLSIEFQRKPTNQTARASEVTLLHGEVNVHQFNVTPELLSQAVQATVVFRRPANRTFTIMLLFRMSERPTPVLYSMKRMHQWDGDTVHMLFPSSHLQDGGTGYVSILSADYGKTSRNKYVAPSVNYTLQIESVHCLSWDGQREWTHEDCRPQPGSSHVRINCSCSHLSPLTVAYGAVLSHVDVGDAAVYAMPSNNLTLSWVIALSLVAYALMLMVCKRADGHCERSDAPHVLPDCAALHQQLYSVTIHTGLRSRSIMTAKVYLVLYGEEGVSETKELYIPERSLFSRNSKDTFILSTAERLGSIWKVRLWHDSAGPSPSWYVSHVLVRELPSWSSWLFLGECWLAVDEHDGKVERKLTVCKQGLGFGKLLYMKLTEYLEDVHPWFSVLSCPRGALTRVQRLAVCLLLHLGCMCASAALVDGQHEPNSLEQGVMDVSMVTGLLSALSVLPAGFLISLLFRLGQSDKRKKSARRLFKDCSVSDISTVEERGCSFKSPVLGWCFYVAWSLCLCLCVTSAVLTGILGLKFSPTKSVLWTYSLLFSVLTCALVIYPALVVRARQRVRYLRLARPPSPDLLRRTFKRLRKTTLIRRFLRSAARTTLTHLKASDWLGQHTRAVATQFVLYHPPSGFFSTVTLLAEWDLAGVLRLRAGVESTRLLLSTGALDCASVTADLLFFLIVMAQMIFQIWIICQNGLLPYCLDLRNWLEGSIIMMSILYYICFAYHFTLKSEKIDQMLREDFKVFIDLENITFWEELTVSLHGVVSFLFLLKSLFILGMHEAMCLPVHALKTVLSNLTWPMMAGAILIMALSSMGTLLLHHCSHAYSSLLRSVTTVLAYTIGPRGLKKWFEWKCSGCIYGLLFLGSLICVVSWAWTAVIKGMVTTLVNMNKRTKRRKQRLTMSELGHYITNKMSALVGQGRTNWAEDHHFVNTFSLEEFEDLVDELLFKLSAFSNSLHHTLPSKDSASESPKLSAFSNSLHHTLPSKDPASESPVSLLSGWNSNFESEVSLQDYPLTDDIMMPPIKQ